MYALREKTKSAKWYIRLLDDDILVSEKSSNNFFICLEPTMAW